jgi:oligopeptide/dipeptide ABC transporter ATP-binding protein
VSADADAVLEVSSLTTEIELDHGAIRPVDDVSLAVRRGETLCLVGESGSGKSMFALSIMRVLPFRGRIVSGSVRLDGLELRDLPEREMRRVRGHRIAIVPQEPMTAFDPLVSVGSQIVETIRAHLELSKSEAQARMLSVLEQVHLPNPVRVAKALPSQLSGGMNQRALIAMALATEPVVLLADEPSTALDVTVQAQVLELLDEIQAARGLAIVLITHDMGVAAMVADRIAVMYAGRIIEHGPTASVFDRPRHPYTLGLIDAARESFEPGIYSSIPGAPPNLLALPPGCAFAPRCPFARAVCEAGPPGLRNFGETRAACVLEDVERPWLRNLHAERSVVG